MLKSERRVEMLRAAFKPLSQLPTPPPLFLRRPGAHTLERQQRWGILVTVTTVLFRRLMEPQARGALLLRTSRFLLNL